MRVIDLLNKIANGEEVPEIIEYSTTIFKYDEDCKNYESESMGDIFSFIDGTCFDDTIEVIKKEIIEEPKKIKKIEYKFDENNDYVVNGYIFDYEQKNEMINAINEIIDYINKGDSNV